MAKKSRIGAQRKLSGLTMPKRGFLFAYSKMDPTCKQKSMYPEHGSDQQESKFWHFCLSALEEARTP